MANKRNQDETRSRLVLPSRSGQNPDYGGAEEAEIAAQVSVPEAGYWGWVVVAAALISFFILDGVVFTFGSIMPDMVLDLGVEEYLVVLINSVAVGVYYISGPVVAGLINRFGFRACGMYGSVICSFSYIGAYVSTSYLSLFIFYGIFSGFGGCLIAMTCSICPGFYFERLRFLALSIAGIGSSLGIMILFQVNAYIVNIAGWRVATLFHSGSFAIIYFLSMTFRPLLSLTVTRTSDPTRTVTFLPNLSSKTKTGSSIDPNKIMPNTTERWFGAVSNANFPTVKEVVDEDTTSSSTDGGPSPSTAYVSKLTLTTNNPKSGLSQRQLKQAKSFLEPKASLTVNTGPPMKKKSCWARLCCVWEEHVPKSRPMYRDDAFYQGKLETLPEYQKSTIVTAASRTGLEYQMAVSRAATIDDLKEKRGVFTIAVRRVLATMLSTTLLKRKSFLCICCSGFSVYLGLLVPYVYLPNRAREVYGLSEIHCSMFVSVIGLFNAVGKLSSGILSLYVSPLHLFVVSAFIAGISVMAFNWCFDLYYQYAITAIYGTSISFFVGLRGLTIVQLYGLESLTNAIGVVVVFQGISSLVSTPLSGILKDQFGYCASFYVAGGFITLGGIFLVPVIFLQNEKIP